MASINPIRVMGVPPGLKVGFRIWERVRPMLNLIIIAPGFRLSL